MSNSGIVVRISRRSGRHGRLLLVGLFITLTAFLIACAPQTGANRMPMTGDVADELQRTAHVAFHRMEIAFLQTGSYTTNALVDLVLPRGVKWTLEEFSDSRYRLRFTADDRPGDAWLVSPAGVEPAAAPDV